MDITDIPLLILVFVFGWIAVSWLRGRFGKQKCKQCGKGTMQEMEAVPQGILHASGHQSSSTTVVRYRVKYQCTHCREFNVVTESR